LRTLAKLGACLAALVLAAPIASAQTQRAFPTKPIRIVVPYVPGGAVDITLRIYSPYVVETLGQQLVIDNRVD
jgi:tripartite-type tricarboxylate transporter receptor subunit TctC